jgi:hypothetical protein
MMKSNLTRSIIIVTLLLLLTSCRNNADVNRGVEVFFLGVLQVLNMIFFGICAVVFSVLAGTGGKMVFKTLGGIFLGLFFLFTAMGFSEVQGVGPRSNEIYIIFLMELAMIIISFIFLLKKPKITQSEKKRQSDLDQVINDNEVL